MKICNEVAIVTGASRGLGFAIARELLGEPIHARDCIGSIFVQPSLR